MTNKNVHRGMSKEKWESLKSVGVEGRYFWISCKSAMIDNPLIKIFAEKGEEFHGPKLIPFTEKPGRTYKKPLEV